MDATVVFDVISSVGLPVALCVWYVWQSSKDKTRLYDVIDKFGEQMNKFNETLITIDSRLQNLEDR